MTSPDDGNAEFPFDDETLPVTEQDRHAKNSYCAREVEIQAVEGCHDYSHEFLVMLRNLTSIAKNECIAEFDELNQGLSRRACAHAFLNLLVTASPDYVRIKQHRSYGKIETIRGNHL